MRARRRGVPDGEDGWTRAFWADFLGVEVESDGQVPGFGAWWGRATDFARACADRACLGCHARIMAGADPGDAVAGAVSGLKAELAREPVSSSRPLPSPEEVARLVKTLTSVMDDRPPLRLTAAQVEQAREDAALLRSRYEASEPKAQGLV